MVAEALARLLARFDRLAVAHAVVGERVVVERLGFPPPHLALVEASSTSGPDAAGLHVRNAWPACRIVLAARDPGPWCDRVCHSIAAVGWVSTGAGERHLARALLFAHLEGRLPDGVAGAPSSSGPDIGSLLTDRELEVLQLLVAGHGGEEIACSLDISRNTVRTHLQNILARLNVHSRVEAATAARRAGIRGTALTHGASLSRDPRCVSFSLPSRSEG